MGQEPHSALAHAGARVVAQGLTPGVSGNIGARIAGDPARFVISATGARLDELHLPGALVDGDDARASVEVPVHRAIYAERPDAGALLHASPPFATLVACSAIEVDARVSTDSAHFVGNVVRVGFHRPGSQELAQACASAAAGGADVLLLDQHGAFTVGPDVHRALLRLEYLEALCRMLVFEAMGFPLRRLPAV
jgi:3-dehydro-4-phosphotetronate decarboxylase